MLPLLGPNGRYLFPSQFIASLAVPTIIIHTAVHETSKAFKKAPKSWPRFIPKYGPSAVGLALIPGMPLVDPPIERAVEGACVCVCVCYCCLTSRRDLSLLAAD